MTFPCGIDLLILLVPLCTTQISQNSWKCLRCQGQQSLDACSEHETCQNHEKCFVRSVEVQGRTEYYSGCTRNNFCDGTNLTPHITHGGRILCHKCCADHSACSLSDLCPKNAGKLLRCLKCNGENSLNNCREQETCTHNQKCFVRKVEVNGRIEYFSGCTPVRHCDGNNLTPHINHGGTVLCHECCANRSACSLSTLCHETPTTAPDLSRKCQVCSGQSCKEHVDLTLCGHPSDLCMTSVENKQDGTQIHSKGCATVSECDDKWLKETTLKPECVSFHSDSTYKFNFNCTFCCKTDGCNRQNMPAVNSLYLIG